jgi:hypothetical protein
MARLQQALVVLTQTHCRSVCGCPYPFRVAAVVQARLRGETSIGVNAEWNVQELCTVLHGLPGRKPEADKDRRWLLRWP